jgi:hypothetical protein
MPTVLNLQDLPHGSEDAPTGMPYSGLSYYLCTPQ